VSTETKEEVLEVIRKEAADRHAPLHLVEVPPGPGGSLRFHGLDWRLAMKGAHMRLNAALALSVALDVAGLSAEDCMKALATAQMPARFQEFRPGVFADVAHNPAKVTALAATIDEELGTRRRVVVLGLTDKKDGPSVLAPLVGVADALVFTRSRYRGADPRSLQDAWFELDTPSPVEVVDSPRDALERAIEWAGEGGAVVITGSTFVVDEALNPEAELLEANALYVPPGEAPERE
jgi:folylpolyglutamate synthase/dihydropteroate synthase